MKKLIVNLLLLATLLSLIPLAVIAVEENGQERAPVTTLYVGSVDALETPFGSGWSFDKDSNVLTLNNCTLTESMLHTITYEYGDYVEYERIDAMIYFEGDLTIELIGTNSVERDITIPPDDYTSYYAIRAGIYQAEVDGEIWDMPSKLTISGTGNLTAGIALPHNATDHYGDLTGKWHEYFGFSAGIGSADNVDLSGLHDGGWVDVYGGIYGVEAPWKLRAFNNYPIFGDNCVITAYRDLECTIENENGYNWNNNDAWRMKVTTPSAQLNSKGLLTLLSDGSASGEGWTWENNVLTLSEGTPVKALDFRSGVDSAKLVLDGDVKLDSNGMGYDANWNYIPAIKATCDLEIDTNSYTLTLNHDEYGYGIRMQQADLLISGGTVISLPVYEASIYSEGGNVTVQNATLIAFGEVVLCDYYYDYYDENGDWHSGIIPGGDLLIEDAVVDLYGGACTNDGDLTVVDSTLYVTSENFSDGLSCSYADMLFQGSDVTIIAPGTLIASSYGTVTFDSCKLDLQMINSDPERYCIIMAARYDERYKRNVENGEELTEYQRWEPDLNAIRFLNMSVTSPANWKVGYTERKDSSNYTIGETVLKDSNGNNLTSLQATASGSHAHVATEKVLEYIEGNRCEGGKTVRITYCTCGGVYSRTETVIEAQGHSEYVYKDDKYSGHDIYCTDCGEYVSWDYHEIVNGSCICGHVCEASYYDYYDDSHHIGYCDCGEELSVEPHSHDYYYCDEYDHLSVCICGEWITGWISHTFDAETRECLCGYEPEAIISFDYNGGVEEYDGIKYYFWQFGAYLDDTLDQDYFSSEGWAFQREGYILLGFTTVKDDASTLVTEHYTITGDVTFYALWASEGNDCDHVGTDRDYAANPNSKTHKVLCGECGQELLASEVCVGEDSCQHCGREFCKHDSSNMTYTPNMYNGGNSLFTHQVYCNICNLVVDEAEECSGGTAYCQQQALCQHCGREYGDLAPEHQLTSPYQENIFPDENGNWRHVYIFIAPNTGRITVTAPWGCGAYIYYECYNDEGETVYSDDCWLYDDQDSVNLDVRAGAKIWIWVSTETGGNGMWTFTYTRTVGCQHENTIFVSNGDGTHNQICSDESCKDVWEANIQCFDADSNGYCDYCGNYMCSEDNPHQLELPFTSGKLIITGRYTWEHYYSWTAPADGILSATMPYGMLCSAYVNGEYRDQGDWGATTQLSIIVQKGDQILLWVGNGIYDVADSWSVTFEPFCEHENTIFVPNGDGTHNEICKNADCGQVVEENIPCSGGKATCMNPAVCEHCGVEYGNLSGHIHHHYEYTPMTGGGHDKISYCEFGHVIDVDSENCYDHDEDDYCDACKADLHKCYHHHYEFNENGHWSVCECGEIASSIDEHVGGTATCVSKAVCQFCETEYGAKDADNHESTEVNYVNNGNTHSATYDCCGDAYVIDEDHTYIDGDCVCGAVEPVKPVGELFEKDGKLYYYENGKLVTYKGLIEVNGNYYYIADYGMAVAGKEHYVLNTNDLTWADGTPIKKAWYEFDAEGKMIIKNGLIDGYYYENGSVVAYKGLIQVGNNFYYIVEGGKAVTNKIHYLTNTNGLTWADGTPVEKAYYAFDAEGKMTVLNGLVDGRYYENGKPVSYKGLIEANGNYYYIADNGMAVTGKEHYVLNTNDLTWADGTPIKKAWYEFDAEGKMIIKNGLIDGYYYENGSVVAYKGLIQVGNDFYYIVEGGKAVTNKIHYLTNTNGLTWADGTAVEKAYYAFDAEGKMTVLNGLVDGRYYENGKPVSYKGLIEVNGNYYYIADNGMAVTGKEHYVLNTNNLTWADGTPIKKGYYTFDEDGKLIIE